MQYLRRLHLRSCRSNATISQRLCTISGIVRHSFGPRKVAAAASPGLWEVRHGSGRNTRDQGGQLTRPSRNQSVTTEMCWMDVRQYVTIWTRIGEVVLV